MSTATKVKGTKREKKNEVKRHSKNIKINGKIIKNMCMCLMCLIKGKVTANCTSAFWRLIQKDGDGDHLAQQQIRCSCSLPPHQRERKKKGEERGRGGGKYTKITKDINRDLKNKINKMKRVTIIVPTNLTI